MLGTAGIIVLLVATKLLLSDRVYTTESSFIPQSNSPTSNFSGIAAQIGIALPMTEPGRSPEFYASLITSRQVLGAVVDTSFTLPGTGPSRWWSTTSHRGRRPR